MYCEKCGKMLEEGTKFCEGCGAPQNVGEIAAKTPEEDSTASNGRTFVILGIIAVVFILIIFGLFKLFGSLMGGDNLKLGWSEEKVEKFMEKKDADETDSGKGYIKYELDHDDYDDLLITCEFEDKKLVCVEVMGEDDFIDMVKDKYGKGEKFDTEFTYGNTVRYIEKKNMIIAIFEYSKSGEVWFMEKDSEAADDFCEQYEDAIDELDDK